MDDRKIVSKMNEYLYEMTKDLTDEELISCKESIKERINVCLKLILETDKDNIR